MIRSVVLAVLCLLLIRSSALAQGDTPESVVGQLMAATKVNDWGRVAGLTHPAALHQLRVLLDPILTGQRPSLDSARQMLFGLPSREAAAAASDSAIMVGLIRFGMSQQPNAADLLRSSSYQLLGTVREGPDTVHVVGRISMTLRGGTVTHIEVTSLARLGSTWRCLLKGDWTALASRLRQALEAPRMRA
jgi:hypothetical protein